MKKNTPVLVKTEFKGVFFGYVKDDTKLHDEIKLTDEGLWFIAEYNSEANLQKALRRLNHVIEKALMTVTLNHENKRRKSE